MVTDADFGYPAYRGFVEWAFKQPELRLQFTTETGFAFPPPASNRLDQSIDEAVGLDFSIAEAFTFWVSETHWGLEHCPPQIQEEIAKRKAK